MLCAFSKREDLQQCLSRIKAHSFDFSEILVFQARPRSSFSDQDDDNGSTDSVYGLALQSTKIQLLQDWRGVDDLKASFPAIRASGVIEEVWRATQDWNACFDILGSLVKSHGVYVVQECNLVFDDVQFPALSLTQFVLRSRASSAGSDWTVVSMDAALSTLSLQDDTNSLPLPPPPLQQWEFVQPTSTGGAVIATTRSYRDVLLENKRSLEELEASRAAAQRMKLLSAEEDRPVWKPLIIVSNKLPCLRVDRDYGDAARDEEDEELYWDICTDSKFASTVSVSAKRRGGVVHMRPAMMDQKLKRIAMKTK